MSRMDLLPIEIKRIIFMFDRTFHVTVHKQVIQDLLNNFFSATRIDLGIPFAKRFEDYQFRKKEIVIKEIFKSIIDNYDHHSNHNFENTMKNYIQINADEDMKQYWFEMIKMYSDSKYSFGHHVFILNHLFNQDEEIFCKLNNALHSKFYNS